MKIAKLLLIPCLFLLSWSCKQHGGLTLEKRHYTKGYYTEHRHRLSDPIAGTPKKVPVDRARTQEPQHTASGEKITKHENVLPSVSDAVQDKDDYYSPLVDPQKNRTLTASTTTTFSHALNLPHRITRALKSSSGTTTSDDVLSLFWIVILVLLILWAVAFLMGGWGLGGLVHLLLVVALVLFILWILKII
jgi:hypothetical protein